MPRSLNKVLLIGYIADEPIIRDIAPDRKVANLTLVTSDYSRNVETGVNEDVPEWHHLSCWGNNANTVASYVHKGSRLYVEGRIKTRSYTDRDGIKRYATDIRVDNLIMLDSRRDAIANNFNANNASPSNGGDINGYQSMDANQTGRINSYPPRVDVEREVGSNFNTDSNMMQPPRPVGNGVNVPSYKTFNDDQASTYTTNQANAGFPPINAKSFNGNSIIQNGGNNDFMTDGDSHLETFGNTTTPSLQGNAPQNTALVNKFEVPYSQNKQAGSDYNSLNNGSGSNVDDEIPF